MKKTRAEILKAIKKMVKANAPDAKVILYGSRARGNAQQNSDWDLLVILNKTKIDPSDFDAISYPIFEFGLNEGEFFSTKLYTKTDWENRSFTPFHKNVEKEGITL